MGTRANASAKSLACREKNGEESSLIPSCSKTMLFWIVSSPANYYFHWLRVVTHQSNVNRYLSQGRTSVRKYREGVEFAKYTERPLWNYFQGKTFWLYHRPVSENFWSIQFGEHRFAICEDVCVSHFALFSHRHLTSSASPRLKNIYRRLMWLFEEIANYYNKVYTCRCRFFLWILARVLKTFFGVTASLGHRSIH